MSLQIKHTGATKTPPVPVEPIDEHVIAIQDLAKDFKLAIEVVADVYWPELAGLKQGATIDLYLPLLTARRVRQRLRRIPRPDNIRKAVVSTS
jgi:uncharacterized protein DUF3562